MSGGGSPWTSWSGCDGVHAKPMPFLFFSHSTTKQKKTKSSFPSNSNHQQKDGPNWSYGIPWGQWKFPSFHRKNDCTSSQTPKYKSQMRWFCIWAHRNHLGVEFFFLGDIWFAPGDSVGGDIEPRSGLRRRRLSGILWILCFFWYYGLVVFWYAAYFWCVNDRDGLTAW